MPHILLPVKSQAYSSKRILYFQNYEYFYSGFTIVLCLQAKSKPI